jgi:hypothetical protein
MLSFVVLAGLSAQASDSLPYGVPDGTRTFTYEQRDLLTWINAIRVEPTAWDDFLYWASYESCSSSTFSAAELAPKAPLSHDVALAIAAATSGSGGSGQGYERLSTALYDTGFSTTFNGWACDPIARSLILDGAFEEAGTSFSNASYTVLLAESDGLDSRSPVVNASQMVDFSRADGNPWYFVAPVKESTGGC